MRSLFAKLFLGAATIILLSMAITLALAFFSSSGPVKMHRKHVHSREKALIYDLLGIYGHQAMDTLLDKGPEALAEPARKFETQSGFRAYLFTADGIQITPPPAPPEVFALVNRLSPEEPAGFVKNGEKIAAARTLTNRNGKHMVAAATMIFPADEFFNRRFPIPRDFWVRLAVSFLLCGAICYALARHLTDPLDKLKGATQKLAAGDLSARVSGSMGRRFDEIADLGKHFDRMAERIEGLVTAQTRLLRDISHELRSPLSRLTVALELAHQRGGDTIRPFLDRIDLESERLNEMIGQLLTLAMLENGTPGKTKVMDLGRIIQAIADDARFEAQLRHVDVTVDACENLNYSGYPEMLYRAIENIVRNALRYTKPGTAIEITAKKAGSDNAWIEITVRDHGPGVPETALPNLFQPFYRIEDSRDRSVGGTGLGLSIAHRSVRLHHGVLSLENADDGGLLARLLLPVDLS